MRPSETLIRPAERSDGEALLSLIEALADYEKLAKPDAAARLRLLEDAFGKNQRIEVFLAEVDGNPVAYAIVFETYSSFLALPTLYLEDIFVLPEHRGREVGHRLFVHCVHEAYERGCGRMEWAVLDWNESAINFYKSLGAIPMDEWTIFRVTGEALDRLAAGDRL